MRHVLVVGASSGLGLAIARRFGALGDRVTAVSRSEPPPSSGTWARADVTSQSDVDALRSWLAGHGNPVDVMVYSAGEGAMGRTLDVTAEQARRSFEVNFWGLDRCVRAVVPDMLARQSGVVIAVLSIAGLVPVAYEAYYGAAKAAAARYLETLQLEHAHSGVAFKALYPGFVDTGFLSKSAWAAMTPPQVHGSGITPEDVAEAVVQLAGASAQRAVVGWRENVLDVMRRVSPGIYGRWARRGVKP